MGQAELRDQVEKIIRNADSRFLKMVHALAMTYSNKNIVAYTTDGTPLSKEDYQQEIKEAEDDIKEGRVFSSEDVKKQVNQWKNG